MQEHSTHVHVAVGVTVTTSTSSVTVTMVVIVIVSTCLSFIVVMSMFRGARGVIVVVPVFVTMRMIMARRCGLVSLGNSLGDTDSVLVRLGPCVMRKRVDTARRYRIWTQRSGTVLIPRTKGGSAEADRSVSVLSTVTIFVRSLDDSRTGLGGVAVQGSEGV